MKIVFLINQIFQYIRDILTGAKICSKCGIKKSLNQYYIHSGDGKFRDDCKICHNNYMP